MIISSKITNEKWIWVKIPKTGTRAYSQLFYPDNESQLHFHYTFHELHIHHQKKYPGFTVTRHPRTRFVSALKHLSQLNLLGKMPCDTIENLVDFLFNNFHENCIPKNSITLQNIFSIDFINYHEAFFKTQVHWAYHPKVTCFKYENLQKFNNWIECHLGYDTTRLEQVGKVQKNHLEHLDFQHLSFQKVVHHLFRDDFVLFEYQENI
jgi:hypothetical protein